MNSEQRDEITLHRQRAEWDAVISLAKQVLEEEPGDVEALEDLAESYEKLGDEENLEAVLRTLVDRHHQVNPYARRLGLLLKNKGNPDAQTYLEQALDSAINRKETDEVEEMWFELVDHGNTPATAFLNYARKLASRRERELAGELLGLLLETGDLEAKSRLEVLRSVAEYMPSRQEELRKPLTEAYRSAYADRPDIDRLVDLSGLDGNDPVSESVQRLERFLKFGAGQYFHHQGWGTGKVLKIEPGQQRVFFDFERKKNHVLTLEMADKSLKPMPPDDLRALLFENPDEVNRMAAEDSVALIKSTLIALGGKASGKEIKAFLLNRVIPEKDWQKWWTATNKKVKTDHFIEVAGTSQKTYTLRDEPEGPDEEYARRFRESKTLRGKMDLLTDYLNHQGERCSPEILNRMTEDLLSRAAASRSESEVVESVFLIQDLKDRTSVNSKRLEQILTPILQDLGRAVDALEGLKGAPLQRRWFSLMEEHLSEDLRGAYEKLLYDGPDSVRNLVAEHVEKTHEEDVLSRLFRDVRPSYREHPGLFIWLAKRLLESRETAEKEGVTRPMLLTRLIGLHEVLGYRAKTGQKQQASVLRSHMSNIRQILKQSSYKRLREILTELDSTSARELWKETEHAVGMEDRVRKEITGYLMAHFPEAMRETGPRSTEESEPSGVEFPTRLLCLESSYQRKKDYLNHLKNVEIPENTREVEQARLLGDLRENAEYHAAKEKQGVLLALSNQLEQEIGSATVVPLEDFTSDYVGFGTRVRFRQNNREKDITLLGPWESMPEEGILSYDSPLGRALWGRSAGETVRAKMGDEMVEIEILSVEPLTGIPEPVAARG